MKEQGKAKSMHTHDKVPHAPKEAHSCGSSMSYTQFKNQIIEYFQESLGEDAEVKIRRILKNNAVYLDGLSILMPGEKISPTIYVKAYYELYSDGAVFQEVVQKIEQVYLESKRRTDMDMEFFKDFEYVKRDLVFKIINYEQNKELLELVPHRRILDFAIVYYCMITDASIGSATITIYHSHMEMWGVTETDLFLIAKEKTPNLLPCILLGMTEVIHEAVQETKEAEGGAVFGEKSVDACLLNQDAHDRHPHMYVMTNKNKAFGAITMMYPDILKYFADKVQSDLFILPSSIHEVILISKMEWNGKISLEEMVREVNDEQVDEEEILSYQVYEYDREKNVISAGLDKVEL